MKWGSLDWGTVTDEIDRKRVHNKLISELPLSLNLKDGRTVIRVVSNPFVYAVHWIKDASGTVKRIVCSDEDCSVCKNESMSSKDRIPQKRYSTFVLLYEECNVSAASPDHTILRRLELGGGVFKKLINVVLPLGDPLYKDYEIIIEKERRSIDPYPTYNMKRGRKHKIDLTNILKQIEAFSVPMRILLGDQKIKDDALSDWITEQRILSKSW